MRSITTLAIAGAALCAVSGADAFAQSTTNFTAAAQEFELTMPDGFCLPKGEDLRKSQVYASLDRQNFTPLDIQRCGSFGENYTLVKYPTQGATIEMSKAQFLTTMSDYFETQAGKDAADAGSAEARADLSRASNGEVDVNAIGVAYDGRDEDCVYIAGRLELSVGDQTVPLLVGSCMTVVGNVVLTVHSYIGAAEGTIAALKARSRAVARTIRLR